MGFSPLYAQRVSEVFESLETSPDGLNTAQAQERLGLYGANLLSEPRTVPWWQRFLRHTIHFMALLLWVAGALTLVVGEPVLAMAVWSVVLINAAFSFWQEYQAQRAIEALRRLLPAYARVIRDGAETQIPAAEVVVGDLLVLAEGDNIPADARVVEEYGLRTNNATLTGESIPSRKTAEASLREDLTEVERPNLILAGTSIVSGTGRAVVFATGMLTQFGRIVHLSQPAREEISPLHQEVERTTRIIALMALGLGLAVFLTSILDVGLPRLNALALAIGIIVAAIPEGLMPTVTLSLAIAVQRMARHGVIVKRLATAEILGTTSVICTDKSGTLTQNQMTVREIWVSGQRLTVTGVGYEPIGEFSVRQGPIEDEIPFGEIKLPQFVRSDLRTLLTAATLCNNSRLNPPTPERPQWTSLGDQTEAALRVVARKGGVEEATANQEYVRVHELPFDARRKRMTTIHRNGRSQVAFVKGAPREVLNLCTQVLMHGKVIPLDQAIRADILATNDEYARNALRVLALAYRELPPGTGPYIIQQAERELIFIGLLAMMDPPRPEVSQAVMACHTAGIRMIVITGDYGLTAESLARRVGMLTTSDARIITGAEVEGMSDAELKILLEEKTDDGRPREVIFARMAPEHKLRVVAALQSQGEVVAVMGDGVNDVPAIRKADIGISMGLIGTDVAKEAADLILTDDNFAAIVRAIEEGRAVRDNIRKFATYIFASNVPEVLPFILTALFHIPLALSVPQILAIDLGTDLLPALALGQERPEPSIMKRRPLRRLRRSGGDSSERDATAGPLFNNRLFQRAFLWLGLIETILCYSGFFMIYWVHGFTDLFNLPPAHLLLYTERLKTPAGQVHVLASTMFFAGVIAAQAGNAFACRTAKEPVRVLGIFSNRLLIAGAVISLFIAGAIIYTPLARIFETLPLPVSYWGWLALYPVILYFLERSRKVLARRVDRARLDQQKGVVTA